MKLKYRNKTISNIWLITIIILTAITISMFALLYDNHGINNTYEDSTIYEVKTTNELVITNTLIASNQLTKSNEFELIEDSMEDDTSSNTSYHDNLLIDKAKSTHKSISTFSNVLIPNNVYLQKALFIAFIIFCTFLFISLPDDWTLLNLKVRLND